MAEHGDEVADHGDETHRESEASFDAEDERESEDGESGDGAVEEGNEDLFADESRDDAYHLSGDDAGFGDGARAFSAKSIPKGVDEPRPVEKEEEGEDESDEGFADDAADGGEAGENASAERAKETARKFVDGLNDF